jgi:hypothetical protein
MNHTAPWSGNPPPCRLQERAGTDFRNRPIGIGQRPPSGRLVLGLSWFQAPTGRKELVLPHPTSTVVHDILVANGRHHVAMAAAFIRFV